LAFNLPAIEDAAAGKLRSSVVTRSERAGDVLKRGLRPRSLQ
jgi:hypothetical protein